MKKTFYSNGKLLITGEYVVLDGADALALPTKFGQSLLIEFINEPKIYWESLDEKGDPWLKVNFSIISILSDLNNNNRVENDEKQRLISILKETQKLNSEFLNNESGFKITTQLDFPQNWGLGSSSTLINNIASWAKVDAFTLLKNTFGGSGYDIAAAQNNQPILYSINNNKPLVKEINLKWNFTDHLFFVHLNKKQNSRDAIKKYRLTSDQDYNLKQKISSLTIQITTCTNLSDLERLIEEHEILISKIIDQPPVKELLFKDYKGSIKSLGAWGGDFILVTGDKNDWDYFRKKGFETIISYNEMIL